MTDPLRELRERLEGVTGPDSAGQYAARCPAHEDRRSSLSFAEGEKGALVSCHAGCDAAEIVAAIGLTLSDLFFAEPSNAPARRIVATYPYEDESGSLLFEVVRYEPKDFRQRTPDGNGGWLWKLNGVRRVPFHLPQLIAADASEPVLIVEGERDVLKLEENGFVATTSPAGAGKWPTANDFNRHFIGRDVVILPDNDAPGREHAQKVATAVLPFARSVKILDLAKDAFLADRIPAKGDVSDFFSVGGTAEHLRDMAQAALPFLVSPKGENKKLVDLPQGSKLTLLRTLLHEPDEQIDWLVSGLLITAGTSLVTARPKVGKSTLSRYLALCVAEGREFLGRPTGTGTVLYLAFEEKKSEVVRHFRQMGATGENVLVFSGAAPADPLPWLVSEVTTHRPALIIIDPLLRFLRCKDANDYSEVTTALEPLSELARNSGAHVLFVHHAKKSGGNDEQSILGSTALSGGVDTMLLMHRHDEIRTVTSVQRYGEDMEEVALSLDRETGLVSVSGDMAALRAAKELDKVLDVLQEENEMTEAEIRQVVGGNGGAVGNAIRAGVTAGMIARAGQGKRGKPFVYSLPSDETRVSRFSSSAFSDEPVTLFTAAQRSGA